MERGAQSKTGASPAGVVEAVKQGDVSQPSGSIHPSASAPRPGEGAAWPTRQEKTAEKTAKSDDVQATSQATELVKLASGGEYFTDQDDGRAYGHYQVAGHWEVHAIASSEFESWLGLGFWKSKKYAASPTAIAQAKNQLEGRARYDGESKPVFVRVGQRDDSIYLDLGKADWRVVEVTESGWEILDRSPVMFRRPPGMQPLPAPERGGHIDEFRRFLTIDEMEWRLLIGWLVASLRPRGPYPILALNGEQGSGKSTACRLFRSCIDPHKADLRSEPGSTEDLLIAAKNSRILAFDNLSRVSNQLSDDLCRLATGGSFSTRKHYTNTDEVIIEAQSPIMLNGIEQVVERSDLMDRCLFINLSRVDPAHRLSEHDIWRDFRLVQPRILGALLTAVSQAMRGLPSVQLSTLPRMADFAQWATAAEPALGLPTGSIMEAYDYNQGNGHRQAIDASPLALIVLEWLKEGEEWSGSATDLMQELKAAAGDQGSGLPKSPEKLSGLLKRFQPNLRHLGVEVDWGFEGRGNAKRRQISLKRMPQETAGPSVPSVPDSPSVPSRQDPEREGVSGSEAAGTPGPVGSPTCQT